MDCPLLVCLGTQEGGTSGLGAIDTIGGGELVRLLPKKINEGLAKMNADIGDFYRNLAAFWWEKGFVLGRVLEKGS